MSIVKDDVTKAVGNLQLCGGQDAGCEAVMHLMLDIFGTSKTEVVVLVGAENAFSSINRQVFSHNIKHICPPIVTFVRNCYNVPARLLHSVVKSFYLMKAPHREIQLRWQFIE